MTNADRIRNMSDEKLAKWICNIICDIDDDIEEKYGILLEWLQSEAG